MDEIGGSTEWVMVGADGGVGGFLLAKILLITKKTIISPVNTPRPISTVVELIPSAASPSWGSGEDVTSSPGSKSSSAMASGVVELTESELVAGFAVGMVVEKIEQIQSVFSEQEGFLQKP